MAERTAAERKNSLRRLYKEKREALSFQDTAFLDNQISAVLFATEEYRGASQILLYASIPGRYAAGRFRMAKMFFSPAVKGRAK